jgi:hypothetical protein
MIYLSAAMDRAASIWVWPREGILQVLWDPLCPRYTGLSGPSRAIGAENYEL